MLPFFNVFILQRHNLRPTEEQAKSVMEEIYSHLFFTEEEAFTEWCGSGPEPDESTLDDFLCEGCNHLYADSNCPNPAVGIHAAHTCDTCCYEEEVFECSGYSVANPADPSRPFTEYHDEPRGSCCSRKMVFACGGYRHCGKHNIFKITVHKNDTEDLLDIFFRQPIASLESIASRTRAQESALQELRGYYELCLEFISFSDEIYGDEV
jgi:hypothetical protein